MTETEIKDMLKDIIDNGEKYECRSICTLTDRLWSKYHLGDEIHDDYEYRKVDVWYVLEDDRYDNNFLLQNHKGDPTYNPIRFEGSKEECEKWIEENTKTWLEENYPLNDYCTYVDISLNESKRESVKEVCKKILEEVDKKVVFRSFENYESGLALCITLDNLEQIIKDLGVNID